MSPLYVCSVYTGVGITLQKSSVYLYTAKNVSVPSCFGNSWLTYFLSFMGFLIYHFTHTISMHVYKNIVPKQDVRMTDILCFKTVLQSELWTMTSIVGIQKHYVIEVKSLPKVERLYESKLASEFRCIIASVVQT